MQATPNVPGSSFHFSARDIRKPTTFFLFAAEASDYLMQSYPKTFMPPIITIDAIAVHEKLYNWYVMLWEKHNIEKRIKNEMFPGVTVGVSFDLQECSFTSIFIVHTGANESCAIINERENFGSFLKEFDHESMG